MDQPAPLISVITPAYNAARFIRRAIDSALGQDGVSVEMVIADDGSQDETLAAVRALGERDERVRAVALPANAGPSKARNAALDAARGEWVAILDADDAILPGRLRHMLDVAASTGADVVLDNFYYYKLATGERDGPGLAEAPGPEMLGFERFVAGARPYAPEADYGLLQPLIRRSFLESHGIRYPAASRHGEDFLFMVDLYLAGAKVALTRVPGYLYTTRSSGWSRTRVNYDTQVRDIERLLERDGIRDDRKLRAVLLQRGRALQRLAAEHGVNRCVYGRDLAGLAKLLLSNRWAMPELVRVVRERFAS